MELYAAQEFISRSLPQYIIDEFPEKGAQVVQQQVNSPCSGVDTGEQFVERIGNTSLLLLLVLNILVPAHKLVKHRFAITTSRSLSWSQRPH